MLDSQSSQVHSLLPSFLKQTSVSAYMHLIFKVLMNKSLQPDWEEVEANLRVPSKQSGDQSQSCIAVPSTKPTQEANKFKDTCCPNSSHKMSFTVQYMRGNPSESRPQETLVSAVQSVMTIYSRRVSCNTSLRYTTSHRTCK